MSQNPAPPGHPELLTLQEAAERLKVHYMTAYRWVRRGELPAFKAGGRLRVRRDDLDAFVASRQVEVGLPAQEPGRTDWDLHLERFFALLCEGRGVDAATLVRKVVADGATAGEVYLHLLAPALHRIGDAWERSDITVADEHRATEITAAIIARLGDFFRRRGPSRATAVTMTAPGEQHAIAAAMAADFLRASGYRVHHLGANVPIEDLQVFLQVVPTDVLCVSLTMPPADPDLVAGIVAAAVASGVAAVLVGGQGVTQADVRAAGAVFVPDLADLASLAEDTLAEAAGTAARRPPR